MLNSLLKHIRYLENYKEIEELGNGFSANKKYKIQLHDGSLVFLRIEDFNADIDYREYFNILCKISDNGVNCQHPISYGVDENLSITYYLSTFIEGSALSTYSNNQLIFSQFTNCTEEEQLKIGLDLGKDLATLHRISTPTNLSTWKKGIGEIFKNDYIQFKNKKIYFKHEQRIIDFIEENINKLHLRPHAYLHNDLHGGNIIINNNQYAGLIDFGCTLGDPIFEFHKIPYFMRFHSVPFCIGEINGYFSNEIPEDFWDIYALYVAMGIFSTIVRLENHNLISYDTLLERIEMTLEDHDYFKVLQPAWFV
ncbi:aminoglycoside phosphotransferase family protein [Paenibacillus vini]|uniref:aminoglycoside phosphotransferase family protein n=1 Tax=Paenibacillus vini TaxID=1476024 RepID=UPI0025B6AA1F|nr:aminoglycoside phosphotransferase family protein [Paenibacillus vini]MDN4066703.1 aminoglycoside phosphotransferase family protein [Paenibacillus vini]